MGQSQNSFDPTLVMSSHHIVRDQQEPALIIHQVDEFPFHYLQQLLEWSPTMICCEPAIDYMVSQGIKIDIAIVSFNATDYYNRLLSKQQPIKIISLSQPDYLSTGLQILQKEGHSAVNIVTTEVFKFEVIDRLMDFTGLFEIVVWDNDTRNLILSAKKFQKWLPEDTMIQIQPLAGEAAMKTEGFREDLDEVINDETKLMILEEGKVSIECDTPPFMITEYI